MTDHGEPYEGERKKGKATAKAKRGLDPVGKEDADVDNDGDVDKSDKYILNRRKKIGQAIRTRAEAYLADGTISTEPKIGTKKITGKDPMTGGPVDNYSTGAVTVSPDDGSKPVRKVGVYAHLELKGGSLSEAQLKMIKMYDDKKKKEEEELSKKDKVSSMMTKDSVKKDDEKEEEKPDMRSKYAMINIIKNKLRAAGQRDPMVMAVDACEENVSEDMPPIPKKQTSVTGDGSKLSPKHLPGGPNSQFNIDGTPKTPKKNKPATGPKGGDSQRTKDLLPKPEKTTPDPKKQPKKGLRYNPFGKGSTANPSNMSGSTGP